MQRVKIYLTIDELWFLQESRKLQEEIFLGLILKKKSIKSFTA